MFAVTTWAASRWLVPLVLASGPVESPYAGHVLVRATPETPEQLEVVLGLASDVWTEQTPRVGRSVDVVLAPGDRASFELSGVDYVQLVDDIQLLVDTERDRVEAAAPSLRTDWFADYRNLPAIEDYAQGLADEAPELVTRTTIGESFEGRPIWALELSGAGEDKPAVLLNGTQHAREWISPMVTMCIADRLISGYASDPTITALLDEVTFLIVPMVNPDGYEYTWAEERFWRKNRRDGVGIDLNRNWGQGWGGEPGSSDDPDSNNYRGTEAFSEPETAAVRDYVQAHPEIAAHVDFHAYSQLVLYPYSYTVEPPPLADELTGWATELAELLGSVHGKTYTPLAGPDFYFAAGTAPDWTIAEVGAHSFTIELRPASAEPFETGFALPREEIRATCDEAMTAALSLGEWVVDGGPEPIPWGEDAGEEEGDDDGEPPDDLPMPEDDSGTDDGGTSSGSGGGSGGAEGEFGASGCGCATDTDRPPITPMWLVMALPLLRRRKD